MNGLTEARSDMFDTGVAVAMESFLPNCGGSYTTKVMGLESVCCRFPVFPSTTCIVKL